MSATARAALLGGGLALLVLAGGAALLLSGTVSLPASDGGAPEHVLVIATAPDDDALSAPFAFVLERGTTSSELLDTAERVVISGTSAESAREAYPFVGGAGVARALSPQTGGTTLDWVVLPPETWASQIDEVGGLTVELPLAISVYQDGRLVLLEKGSSKLSGEELVALASALPYVQNDENKAALETQMSAGISAIIASKPDKLAGLVAEKRASSSLDPGELTGFSAR